MKDERPRDQPGDWDGFPWHDDDAREEVMSAGSDYSPYERAAFMAAWYFALSDADRDVVFNALLEVLSPEELEYLYQVGLQRHHGNGA